MGLVKAKMTLKNPLRPDLQPVEVEALADPGALQLCLPAHVQIQLSLEETGKRQSVPYVGPVELHFANRTGFTGALVLGDEVLLGAIPMEDMDLVIIPRTRTLAVNPDSPTVATSVVKSSFTSPAREGE